MIKKVPIQIYAYKKLLTNLNTNLENLYRFKRLSNVLEREKILTLYHLGNFIFNKEKWNNDSKEYISVNDIKLEGLGKKSYNEINELLNNFANGNAWHFFTQCLNENRETWISNQILDSKDDLISDFWYKKNRKIFSNEDLDVIDNFIKQEKALQEGIPDYANKLLESFKKLLNNGDIQPSQKELILNQILMILSEFGALKTVTAYISTSEKLH